MPDTSGEMSLLRELREIFGDTCDFVSRTVVTVGGVRADIVFIDGMTDMAVISRVIIEPLTDAFRFGTEDAPSAAAKHALLGGITGAQTVTSQNAGEIAGLLMHGFCAVIFGGEAVCADVKSAANKRGIGEPKEEKVVKGAKDAFNEVIRLNTAMVRRRIHDSRLRVKHLTAGEKTDTGVEVVWLEGFTDPKLVGETVRRLADIKAEGVLTSAVIEQALSPSPASPFPQLITTERPDKFCLNLLEGRVGVFADGIPVGYLAPGTFAQFFKAPEDSAGHFIISSCLTLLRYLALAISLFLPAFYVAASMYHTEMIPTRLMQSVIEARKAVPFPTAAEVLLMLLAFELLHEASLRLPNPVGQTVSIIGGLIVGQSAVEASIVSPVVVIVVALAGISGFTVTNQDMAGALRLCRLVLTLAAVIFGLFGAAAAASLIAYHLSTIEYCGTAYLAPFAGSRSKRAVRALVRSPSAAGNVSDPELYTGEGK